MHLVRACVLQALVRLVVRLFPDFQFRWVAEEARRNLPLELDFISEGRNCEAVGKMFAHLPFFKVTGGIFKNIHAKAIVRKNSACVQLSRMGNIFNVDLDNASQGMKREIKMFTIWQVEKLENECAQNQNVAV